MTLLLDSVILIDHFNGIAAATRYLAEVRADAAVSVITRDRKDSPPERHRFVVVPYRV